MSRLSDLEIFVAVVDEGSFTAAADRLGISKSHASKRVSELEDRLGVQLMQRTTRSLSLTDAGRVFYERGTQIVDQLEGAERAVRDLQDEPRGELKITAPMSFGRQYVSQLVTEFLEEHEHVAVELDLSDRKVDLVEGGFDLAVRIGELRDSSLLLRKLAPATRYCCASPEYLDRHGTPEAPSDLTEHDCLKYTYGRLNSWRFVDGDGDEHFVQVEGRFKANNGDVLVEACLAGRGIALIPDFLACEHLRDGTLTRILDDWMEWRAGVYALYPHDRNLLSAKVERFAQFLADRLSPPPWR